PDRIEIGEIGLRHEAQHARGGALRDRGGRKSARRGQDAGTGYRLQECSSVHEAPTFGQSTPGSSWALAFSALFGAIALHGTATKSLGKPLGIFPTASPNSPSALAEEIMKLDSKTIAALTLDGKRDVIHFHDAMPGFGFRLRLSGGKLQGSWWAQYKRGKKPRRTTLGRAEVLGAEVARAAAKKALAQVSLGGAPQAERQERRAKDRHSLLSEIDRYLAAKQARP